MTRKIPKLKEHTKPRQDSEPEVVLPVESEPEPAVPSLPVEESTDERLDPNRAPDQLFPAPANDLELKHLIRVRAFYALKAKAIEQFGALPDDLKDEFAELERSL